MNLFHSDCVIYKLHVHTLLAVHTSVPPSQATRGSRVEWQRAIGMYRLAAAVLPGNGNPFNQLAVMSYQSGDELRAVYFYFRCEHSGCEA